MRILMLNLQRSGVGYYRHWLPAEALNRLGIKVDYWPDEDNPLMLNNTQWLLDRAKNYDLFHVGYATDLEVIKVLTALRNYASVPFITDIDDDILNVPNYNLGFSAYHGGAQGKRIARMQLRLSDGVSVSTQPLQEAMCRETRRIEVLPNCYQPTHWQGTLRPKPDNDIRICFAANQGRLDDINETRTAIEAVMREHKNVRLFFIACAPEWAKQWLEDSHDPTANRAFFIRPCFDIRTYRLALQWINPDIFVCPVVKNRFNESKSHIKIFDAVSAQAASICTDWPTYGEVPKECALKVDNTHAQWAESLSVLVTDPTLRQRVVERAKAWVADTQTIDKHAEKWVKLYEETIARGPISDLSEIVRPGVGGGDGMDRSPEASGHEGQPTRQGVADVRG